MVPENFKHYDLRLGLDVVVRYEGIGACIVNVVHRLAHDDSYPTVIHVHFNVPMDYEHVPGTDIKFYTMPGLVGLVDKIEGKSSLFNTEIAESYIVDHLNMPLRRLDIHFNSAWRRPIPE